jgi:HSP20 family protein
MLRRSWPGRGEGREALATPEWSPAVDIVETENEYQLKVELPEMKREELKVSVQNGQVRIEGERKQEKEEKGKRFHRVERFYGSFLRTFTLPDDVDETKARAEMKDGLLLVHIPRSESSRQRPPRSRSRSDDGDTAAAGRLFPAAGASFRTIQSCRAGPPPPPKSG